MTIAPRRHLQCMNNCMSILDVRLRLYLREISIIGVETCKYVENISVQRYWSGFRGYKTHTGGNTVFLTGNDFFFRKKRLYDYQTAAYNELITYLHHAANYEATDATRLLQFDIKC